MDFNQIAALVVLVLVVGVLIHGRIRSDVAALTAAAALLVLGVIRPVEVQSAFASPAVIALACLFVIAYAIELSGLLGLLIRQATRLCARLGAFGLWIVMILCGGASAFLNNTPIVVLAAPVVKDVAHSLNLSPKRFLIPLSYITIMGGACTLIGTSTNLLVNDMARNAGQPLFSLFEITPVALIIAAAGGLYLFLLGGRLLAGAEDPAPGGPSPHAQTGDGTMGDLELFAVDRPFDLKRALISMSVFVGVILAAALGVAPIAAAAFAGAVLLILLRVISPEEAYAGLRPEVLLLIAGMVVVGLSIEVTGLAASGTALLIDVIRPFGPLAALAILYGVTLFATELLSNAAVAVLITPVAVALAESLGVEPRPFLIAVMMAASAAFATPFGYQTNVLVFQVGRYKYMDFVRVGVPLNLVTWLVGVIAIPIFFPF
ncbi:di/tricarboxylate transporter [Brevundimonas bullata]|uniref:Di/tricarboxylate transporter n=1 Tax=Brevundimonas bullata TaxID=13160 RepID=A0A7W7IR75_9CAUL|nr:SLC13/DASS family transporter [Brevundimonas bullata]MBB4799030.1 di/tricarboxylate transporter [Brevundimonas bullata]MBB6383990.1 di/tricarboxylate transporter [Brevundimonas bullata]